MKWACTWAAHSVQTSHCITSLDMAHVNLADHTPCLLTPAFPACMQCQHCQTALTWQNSSNNLLQLQITVPTPVVLERRSTLDMQNKAQSPDISTAAESSLQLQMLAKMTGHVVAHLPNIWQLVQVLKHEGVVLVMDCH